MFRKRDQVIREKEVMMGLIADAMDRVMFLNAELAAEYPEDS